MTVSVAFHRISRVIIAVTVLLFTACATSQGLMQVTVPTQRVEFDGFSILPPAGEGWVAVNPPPLPSSDPRLRVRAYFVKRLTDPSSPAQLHRLTAVVRTVDVGETRRIENRSDFLRQIARAFSGTSRVDKCLGWDCATYESTTEDRANPNFPGYVFVIDKRGFVILHPDSPRLAINLEYRQYYGEDVLPLSMEALQREVEPFPRSLEFTPRRTTHRQAFGLTISPTAPPGRPRPVAATWPGWEDP